MIQGMFVFYCVVNICTVRLVGNFMYIKFSWISFSFLSMIIYKVLYTRCLRYNVSYSAWLLEIRISICFLIAVLCIYCHKRCLQWGTVIVIQEQVCEMRYIFTYLLSEEPESAIQYHVTLVLISCKKLILAETVCFDPKH